MFTKEEPKQQWSNEVNLLCYYLFLKYKKKQTQSKHNKHPTDFVLRELTW